MRYVLVLLLAGCVTQPTTPAERAVLNMAKYGPACEIYGFTKGTPEFGNCVMQLRANAMSAVSAAGGETGVEVQTMSNMQELMRPK